MKNKTVKILTIVSIIVIVLGVLGWFGTDLLVNLNETDKVVLLFSVFGSVALRLLIIGITAGILIIIWLIYGIIIMVKKIKNNELKGKNVLITSILLILFLLILTFILSFKFLNDKYIKNKYDYYIKFQEGMDTYNIYKIDNEIKVNAKLQVECIKEPCLPIETNHIINFSDANMQTINNFIKNIFSNQTDNYLQLYYDNLNQEQYNILKSIIYNDEKILNNNYELINKKITIITDSKYKTLQNDGGSNYNVYYELDFSNNIIKKYEDHYIGFKGYEYQGKLIYEKNITPDISNEMYDLVFKLFFKEDIKDPLNYSPYTIKIDNEEKDIYNEESIALLKKLLNKIDTN